MTAKKDIKVLVVDDEEVVRDFLLRLLALGGVTVTAVDSGYKAIGAAKQAKFDIIFLDVRMTGMDGLETYRELKKINPLGKYVMMTGYAVDEILKKAREEGATAFLKKPFDISQVITLIDDVAPKDSKEALNILVVDDDNAVLSFFGALFKDEKYNALLVNTDKQALDAVKNQEFNLVFLDVYLAESSGIELYFKIRNLKPDLNIFLMTGLVDKAANINSLNIKGCLYKPFDVQQILSVVEEARRAKEAI
ncbi:MAG: response regulator [Candidatus Omnitrophota bacterium]|nr:response regulator [Candidatus Omnitrophota bacterium]MBU1928283.1 response regulator [Candidatus Omnitrophota bacterium]MBU2035561.1 response regulator [Candidatus Omnitrophota bacterium]